MSDLLLQSLSLSCSVKLFCVLDTLEICADEMGLGKTVEVLACILAHAWPGSGAAADRASADAAAQIARRRKERIECSCGETSDDETYGGSWVQCNKCLAWQHAYCAGYVPKKRRRVTVKEGAGAEAALGKVECGLRTEPNRDGVSSEPETKDAAGSGEGKRIGGDGGEVERIRTEGEDIDQGGRVMGTEGEGMAHGKGIAETEGGAPDKGGEVMRQGGEVLGRGGKAIRQEGNCLGNATEQAGGSTEGTRHPTSALAASGSEPNEDGQNGKERNLKRKRTGESEGTSSQTATKDSYVPFTCGECSALLGGVQVEGEVGATLIVCPTAILQQWREEIAK